MLTQVEWMQLLEGEDTEWTPDLEEIERLMEEFGLETTGGGEAYVNTIEACLDIIDIIVFDISYDDDKIIVNGQPIAKAKKDWLYSEDIAWGRVEWIDRFAFSDYLRPVLIVGVEEYCRPNDKHFIPVKGNAVIVEKKDEIYIKANGKIFYKKAKSLNLSKMA